MESQYAVLENGSKEKLLAEAAKKTCKAGQSCKVLFLLNSAEFRMSFDE